LMACVGAAQAGARVLLVEKGDRLGRKLIISGGGRCNVTNNKEIDELVRMIPGNGRFLYSAFNQFGPPQIRAFFEGLGVALKEEDHGRMFPVTDKATTVAATLIRHIETLGVAIRLHAAVERVLYEETGIRGIRLKSGEEITGRAVILAVGGKSVPRTGSTGDGYAWAEAAGHSITPLFPTEVPILCDEPWIQNKTLQGLSLRDAALMLVDEHGKKLTTQLGDMIFTHFGVSGPAALRLGHYVNTALQNNPGGRLMLRVDFMPLKRQEALLEEVRAIARLEPKKTIKNALKGLVPERALAFFLERAGLLSETPCAHLPKGSLVRFVEFIKGLEAHVTGTQSIEEAFVTGGGIDTKEIDPKTMASKRKAGLYFAGEIMDVHAHTGGYNITIALSSGYVAGQAAGRMVARERV
jgi:predicted Rossmann fold flavoprotein